MSKKNGRDEILVPIDFKEQSLIALGQSYNLAKEYNAELVLLHVIDDGNIISSLMTGKQQTEMKKNVQKKLDALALDIEKKKGVKVDTMIAKGKPYEKIIEVADMLGAIMIIMGHNSRKKLSVRFIGSNALRVVREAECPVITIKGKHHRQGCKNIVLPLDLTKETKDKVRQAVAVAQLGGSNNQAAIRVVSVLQSSDEFIVNRLTRQLEQVRNFIQKKGIECSAEIIKTVKGEDSPAQCIVDYAHKVEGDLLIIMTQQEANFTRMFIGSTAQEVVNTSDIPVMSIIPGAHKYKSAEQAATRY
ncbi:MAG: universal stress protein [Bacteroidetes bacterium]|nr:universal stress protein [Bacteroidota bacterium]